MDDAKHKLHVLEFSRTFVNIVSYILFPGLEKIPDQNELSMALMNPLKIFLDRHKMEIFFLYREEIVRYGKDMDETAFKELLESIICDFKEDSYDPKVFSYLCIVISYYAVVARRQDIPSAHKVAARVIYDTILHFEKDEEVKEDIIEGIKNNLLKTAERIRDQTIEYIENSKENCPHRGFITAIIISAYMIMKNLKNEIVRLRITF